MKYDCINIDSSANSVSNSRSAHSTLSEVFASIHSWIWECLFQVNAFIRLSILNIFADYSVFQLQPKWYINNTCSILQLWSFTIRIAVSRSSFIKLGVPRTTYSIDA